VEAPGGVSGADDGQPDGDGHRGGRGGADQGDARSPRTAWPPLRADASTQARRRLDLGGGAPCEGEEALLLGQPVCELGRRRDPFLERRATLGRERAVRERGQLGFVRSAVPQHGNRNASSE
jgi:hypothetical protein